MKTKHIRLLFLGILSSLMFSCNPTDCTNGVQDGNETGIDCGGNCPPCTTSPNGNSSQNNDYWMFEITINGITQEAEGYGHFESPGVIGNSAYTLAGGNWVNTMQINDPSSSSYISGNLGSAQLLFENITIGVSEATFSSTWYIDAVESAAGSNYGSYSFNYGAPVNQLGFTGYPKLPISISDLGTTGDGLWSGGQSFKGEYSGTIYLADGYTSNSTCSIPLDISIKFESLRQ